MNGPASVAATVRGMASGSPSSPRTPKGRPSGPGGRGSPSGGARGAGAGSGSSRRPPPGSGGRGGRSAGGRGDAPTTGPEAPKAWGSLGRKGASRLRDTEVDRRDGIDSARDERRPAPEAQARWERVDDVRSEASGAVRRARSPTGPVGRPPGGGGGGGRPPSAGDGRRGGPEREKTPERRGRAFRPAGAGSGGAEAADELRKALGATRGARANERLRDASHAFERERFEEARKLLKPLAEQAPQATAVRELLGLTYYRLGRWADATRELEAFRDATGSAEQHPVLADAYRGLGRHQQVEELWEELRESSLSADLVAEGRIVMAGSLADRKMLREAVALLQQKHPAVKRPKVHHLRQAYALADLYERAGDAARARELFAWVAEHEPDFADAAERAAAFS
jgi:hypothetical protein